MGAYGSMVDLELYCRSLDVLQNRVHVVNTVVGSGYAICRTRRGRGNVLELGGHPVREFGHFDRAGCDSALVYFSGAADMAWALSRDGLLCVD